MYPEAYRRGATLLTFSVSTDEQVDQVTNLLESNGAIDIDERSATWNTEGTGVAAGDSSAESTHIAGTHMGADRAQVVDRRIDSCARGTAIPIIEGDLRVGKREVNAGRVRVVSRATERLVERP